MPTTNKTLRDQWQLVANSSDTKLLITWGRGATVEIATTGDNTAPDPSLVGHVLSSGDAVTRNVLGDGYVWMKTTVSSYNKSTNVVITK